MINSQTSSELELAGKEALWIVQLKSLDIFKKILGDSFQNSIGLVNAAENLARLQYAIMVYLKKPMDDTLLKAIMNIMVTTVQAPFSNRALIESRVLCTAVEKITLYSLRANRRVLIATENFVVPNTPKLAAFQDLMVAMTLMPLPASDIAQALTTGQISALTSSLTGVLSKAVSSVGTTISSLFKNCPDPKPGDPVDVQIDEVNDPRFERK
jgi:hypothetical protein